MGEGNLNMMRFVCNYDEDEDLKHLPIGMKTYTSTVTEPCKHANGWFVTVKFWIFSKRIFVCSDCGMEVKPKQQ